MQCSLFVQVGGAAQFLSCPTPGPHLLCASLSVQTFLRERVAELVAEKDVPDYRTALQLALGTLNVCVALLFSLPHMCRPYSPLSFLLPPPPKSSQSCLKALVVFSAGTLETLTDLFDRHNADRQVRM